jgi:hypothetical protein
MSDLAQLDAAMTAVLDMIPQRRRRSPVEAPWHLTHAYARLIVAAGFARLGDAGRARALRDESVTAPMFGTTDPVHRFLSDAFTLRIEQTCELRRVDLPLSAPLVEQLAALDRTARYKVDRLREYSPTLAADVPSASIDAIASYKDEPIAADEHAASRALSRQLHASRLAGRGEHLALLADLDTSPADPPSAAALAIAGARVHVDDRRGRPTFAAAIQCLSRRMPQQTRLDLVRDIARGATHAPAAFAIDQLRQLMPSYREVSDSFGTNSHYCLSVLHFVESLVLAITDLRLATLDPGDPTDAPYVAWPFALS